MIRVLIALVGLAGLLLVWAICGSICLDDIWAPLPTVSPSGDPILYFAEFSTCNGRKITIQITPWTKMICASVTIVYTVVFLLFTASLFRRQH